MLRYRLLSVLGLGLASAFVASACSDDDSPSEEFINDYCNMMMPCCSEAGLSSDPSECKMILTAFTAGTKFNQSKADQCIAAMRAASSDPAFCTMSDEVMDDSGACEGVFDSGSGNGSVQPGGTCDSDSDCADSAEGKGECFHYWDGDVSYDQCLIVADGQEGSTPCIGTRSGSTTMYGGSDPTGTMGYICDEANGLYCDADAKCASMLPIGESCSYSDRCVAGAYCDSTSGLCAARVPVGSTCTSSWDDTCVDGTYCNEDTKVCTQQFAGGTACTASEQCLSGWCSNDVCDPDVDFELSLFCAGD